MALPGCREVVPRDEVLIIGADTIRLAPGVQIHDIRVQSQPGGEFEPDSVTAPPGDVIRFQTADAHTHVLVFQDSVLPAQARDWLAAKSQQSSPPLLIQGATWIVSLEGAPRGTYVFQCITHGATGRITVSLP